MLVAQGEGIFVKLQLSLGFLENFKFGNIEQMDGARVA